MTPEKIQKIQEYIASRNQNELLTDCEKVSKSLLSCVCYIQAKNIWELFIRLYQNIPVKIRKHHKYLFKKSQDHLSTLKEGHEYVKNNTLFK